MTIKFDNNLLFFFSSFPAGPFAVLPAIGWLQRLCISRFDHRFPGNEWRFDNHKLAELSRFITQLRRNTLRDSELSWRHNWFYHPNADWLHYSRKRKLMSNA